MDRNLFLGFIGCSTKLILRRFNNINNKLELKEKNISGVNLNYSSFNVIFEEDNFLLGSFDLNNWFR